MNTRALPNLDLRRRVAAPDTREGVPTMVQIVPQSEDGRRPEVSAEPSERARLQEDRAGLAAWKCWGPYLSERQWGTVREDYSPRRRRLGLLSARPRAQPGLPLGRGRPRRHLRRRSSGSASSLALWNGRDPILKERLFGLTNGEGNHGEDVKELYYYLDATPTHSLPEDALQVSAARVPVRRSCVEENRRRGKDQPEFELLDTGIFDDDRYFDVFVEYAKAGPDDILMRVTVAQPRAGAGDAAPAAAALVPQHLVVEAATPRTAEPVAAADAARSRRSTASSATTALLLRRRRRSCCSATTRRTSPRLFGADGAGATSRTPSTTTSSAATRDAVNPEQHRHQGGGALSARRPAPAARSACGCGCTRREPADAVRRLRRRSSRSACAEADEFYAELQARTSTTPTRGACSGRRSPA